MKEKVLTTLDNRHSKLQQINIYKSATNRNKVPRSSANLRRLLEDCKKLNVENFMLERYLCKVGVSSCSRLDRGSTDSFISEARMRSKIHTVIPDTVPSQNKLVRLSSAQKCFIAQYEQVELRKDIKQFAETCDDLLDEYLACVEKLRLMQEHSSKERKLFEKRVAAAIRKPAVFGDGHRVLLRYHRTYLKRLDVNLRNLHLENENLRIIQKRLHRQLFERKLSGDPATRVDFGYLQIRGNMLLEIFDDLGSRCLYAKTMCNQCTRLYEILKLQLTRALAESTSLNQASRRKHAMKQHLALHLQGFKSLCRVEAQNTANLSKRLKTYKSPPVADFIESVKQERSLVNHLFECNRKMRIAKLSFAKHQKIWAQVNRQARSN